MIIEIALGIVLGFLILAFWPVVLAVGAGLLALAILLIGGYFFFAWQDWPSAIGIGLFVWLGYAIYRDKKQYLKH